MLHETLVVGFFQCNCQILACEKTREAVIIDPGGDAKRIIEVIRHYDLNVRYLLHTHAHLDHISATRAVYKAVGGETVLHRKDLWLYNNLSLQGVLFGQLLPPPPAVDRFVDHEERIVFGLEQTRVIHTPGHSPGSICFHFDHTTPFLFSGDTLFAQSIGRTDLWGGSYSLILESIQKRLLTLIDDTKVYPGHGAATTIGDERRNNPFLTSL